MDAQSFILDLAVILTCVGAVAAVCARFKWPKVIAYILVGVLLGPHTFGGPLVVNEKSIDVLGQIGVIFLMFTLGLEFSMRKLKRLGRVIFPTAALDMAVMIWVGYLIGTRLMGWGAVQSLFLGAAISDSATTMLAKTISEMGWNTRRFTRYIFGVTITEDILCIAVIALLTGLVLSGQMQLQAVLLSMGGLLVFLTGVIGFGLLLVPRAMRWIGRLKDDESLLLTILGFCFFVSYIAARLKYSLALGAFLVGVMGAESEPLKRIYNQSVPLRTMFSAIFFVTIGLMVDPVELARHAPAILGLTAVVVVGKSINNTVGGLLTGMDLKNALQMGMGLGAIGEFAYLVALIGVSMGAVDTELYQIAVGVSVLSTLLSPFILRASDPVGDWVDRRLPARWRGYLETYQHWADRFQHASAPRRVVQAIRINLLLLAFHLILVAVIYLAAGRLAHLDYTTLAPFVDRHKDTLLWFVATLVMVPFAILVFFRSRQFGESVADALIPGAVAATDWSLSFRRVTRLLGTIAGMLILFVEVALLSSSIMPRHLGARAVMAVVFVLVAYFGWSRFRRLGVESLGVLRHALMKETETDPNESAAELLDVHMDRVRVMPDAVCVGQSLRELNLRARVGASVVGIDRDGRTLVNPTAGERLAVGDRILLLGDDEQLAEAKLLLLRRVPQGAAPREGS